MIDMKARALFPIDRICIYVAISRTVLRETFFFFIYMGDLERPSMYLAVNRQTLRRNLFPPLPKDVLLIFFQNENACFLMA